MSCVILSHFCPALPPALDLVAYPCSQSTGFCVRALARPQDPQDMGKHELPLLQGTQGRRGCHEPLAATQGPWGGQPSPWASISCPASTAPHLGPW